MKTGDGSFGHVSFSGSQKNYVKKSLYLAVELVTT